jgi:RNA polymerase subunit RPABC4/transcription elongation factor Spt4
MEHPNRMSRKEMESDTTANFSGYMGIFDAKQSWVARLMGARKVHKGIYAFEINDTSAAAAGGSKLREVDEDEDGDYEADGDDIIMQKKHKYDAGDDDELNFAGGLMEGLEGGGGEDNGESATKKSRVEADDLDSFFNEFAK